MIPLAVGLKAYLLYFCSIVNWKLFYDELCEKKQFFCPDFVDFDCDLRTDLLNGIL